MKKSKMPLPKWECSTAHEAEQLEYWTNRELDILHAFEVYGNKRAALMAQQDAIALAVKGDIEPLEQLYPELAVAGLLRVPPQKRGRKTEVKNSVWNAAVDVKNIRAIWELNYGSKNRRVNDRVVAEQIAADRWDVDVHDVIEVYRKLPGDAALKLN